MFCNIRKKEVSLNTKTLKIVTNVTNLNKLTMHKGGERKPDLNAASLLDLKAELFRKQEEFKQQKLQNLETGAIKGKHTVSNKKPSLFSKKNVGVSERAEKDFEAKQEEEDVFLRSKKSLESKAKLYEKISSGVELPDEDGSGLFLVDFQKKVLDDEAQRREKERVERERLEEEEERRLQEIPVPAPQNEDEEWVDYVDAYGRTRRCLKQDLPTVKERDTLLQGRQRDRDTLSTPHLLSDDMAGELERQRWEQAELTQMEQEKQGPIHYADVRHNEVRTHGVGFYQFNAEEQVRQAQMEQLQNLREQTKSERSKSDRVKEKRKAALAARLAKVKQRKREKLGLPEEEELVEEDEEGEIGPLVSEEVKEPQLLTRDDSWRTNTPSTREWDRGKQVSMEQSERAWLEKQRAERENEFAPPSFYYGNHGNQTGGRSLADIEGKNQINTESPSLKDTMISTDSGDNDQDKGHVEKMVGEQLNILRTSMENKESKNNQEISNEQQQQLELEKAEYKMYKNISNSSQVVVAPIATMGLYDEATHTTSVTSAPGILPMFTDPPPGNMYAPLPINVHVPPPVNIYAPPHVNTSFQPQGYTTMPSNYFPTGAPNFSFPPPPLAFPSGSSDSQAFSLTQGPFATFSAASQSSNNFPQPITNFPNFNVPPPPIFGPESSDTNAASYPYVPSTGNTTTEQAPVKKVVPKMSIVDTRFMGND
ncbi:coiled-coil domain-containing protein 174-like isoform X2 [Dreissena polymorpha]|uniref:coiled-coil domain-containing protein 174-like isoform X2 n=1 Tax=Dreissena polymorpha TaxID=45954 RepID=UPI0022656AE0|nr:coiled-coil domain-containing protein 174-like isoform X2 [Dreissena polymorpha]